MSTQFSSKIQIHSRSISDCNFCNPLYSTKAQYECASCARQFCLSHFANVGGRVLTPLSPAYNDIAPHLAWIQNRKSKYDKIICNDCVPSSVLDGVIEPRVGSYNPWGNTFSTGSEIQSSSVESSLSPVQSPSTFTKPLLHISTHKEAKDDSVRTDKPKRTGRKEYKNKEPTPKVSRAVKETLRCIEKNQKELAAEIGTSTTTISSYLTGKVRSKGWTKLEMKLQQWMRTQKSLNNVSDFSDDAGSDLEESDLGSIMAHDDSSSSEASEVDNSVESEGSSGFQSDSFRPSCEVDVYCAYAQMPSDYNFGVYVV